MDILIVTDNNLETVGGEQESIKILLNEFKNYYNIGVYQPGAMENKRSGIQYFEKTKKTRVKELIKNPIEFIKYYFSLYKIIRNKKPKIIHTQAQVSFFIVAFIKKIGLVPSGIHLIHTERSLFIKYNSLFKMVFFFLMKELDTLITTTNMNMKDWKTALEERNFQMDYRVIENTAGQNFEILDSEKVKVANDVINVSFAGRYHDVKNWPLAMEISIKLYNILGEKVKVFMAVGCLDKPSENSTINMFKTMKKIMGNNFEGWINIPIEEMDELYYQTDVFILTSKTKGESFGRTLVEAMSRYTAVLTTDAGGPEEVVGDQNNILTTSAEFVNRVLEYHSNKELLDMEKKKNLVDVRERYSLKNNLVKHKNMYQEFLNNFPSNSYETMNNDE